jgi:hypothetical protein
MSVTIFLLSQCCYLCVCVRVVASDPMPVFDGVYSDLTHTFEEIT